MQTGLPPKVEACEPGTQSMISGAGHHDAQRHARSNTLRHANDVGLHAGVLDCPPLAGAANAALHFVDDEQNAVLVADAAQFLHEDGGRDHVPAFALNGLDEDGRYFFRRKSGLEQLALRCSGRNRARRPRHLERRPSSRDTHRDSAHGLRRARAAQSAASAAASTR